MTTIAEARAAFDRYDHAWIEHLFRGAPEPIDADYDYRHDWIIIGDQAFNRSTCFPELADQPWMD